MRSLEAGDWAFAAEPLFNAPQGFTTADDGRARV